MYHHAALCRSQPSFFFFSRHYLKCSTNPLAFECWPTTDFYVSSCEHKGSQRKKACFVQSTQWRELHTLTRFIVTGQSLEISSTPCLCRSCWLNYRRKATQNCLLAVKKPSRVDSNLTYNTWFLKHWTFCQCFLCLFVFYYFKWLF